MPRFDQTEVTSKYWVGTILPPVGNLPNHLILLPICLWPQPSNCVLIVVLPFEVGTIPIVKLAADTLQLLLCWITDQGNVTMSKVIH